MSKNGPLNQSLEAISYHLKNEVAGIILIADTIKKSDSDIDVSLVSSIDYRVKKLLFIVDEYMGKHIIPRVTEGKNEI